MASAEMGNEMSDSATPAAPLRARFFPMGFPVDVATNSTSVILAATSIWSSYRPAFQAPPASIHVIVKKARPGPNSHLPSYNFVGNSLRVGRPPDNFGTCDLRTGAAFARLTSDVANDPARAVYFFLEPLAYVALEALHLTALHSACVARDGRALLLCGGAGAGKTSLAYACARSGWTYLSGDATNIVRDAPDALVVGRPHHIRFREHARHLFPELARLIPQPRPNGKLDIEADPRELGLSTAVAASVAHIVFLNRAESDLEPRITSYPRERAALQLHECSQWGGPGLRKARRQSIERLLDLPLHELTYFDANDAEPMLRALLDTSDGLPRSSSCERASHAML